MFESVHSVMFHVSDTEKACEWYSRLLEIDPIRLQADFPVLRVGNTEICFHPADSKVSSGKSGVITYWRVADFTSALSRAENIGGILYRGPLKIENGEVVCQILDPFGNLFGLTGRAK